MGVVWVNAPNIKASRITLEFGPHFLENSLGHIPSAFELLEYCKHFVLLPHTLERMFCLQFESRECQLESH